VIRKGAVVGAKVILSPGIEIGQRAVIGAGAVVTKGVEEEAVMVGNPAKQIRTISELECPFDLMGGKRPYEAKASGGATNIPMVDLRRQHQNLKMELRLAMDRVILNTRFVNGKEVGEFEREFARFCRAEHCVGTSSGTDALTLTLSAFGIQAGDEVITSPHTFIATAEAILAVGAKPVFADIDETSFNLDPRAVEKKITPRTKAIVPVHLYGNPASMEEITEMVKDRGILVVGDAAQAHGAEFKGRNVAQWGDAACFSFFPGKNLGAYGDAGAVVTSNAELAERAAALRNHGRKDKFTHLIPGCNARLDTLQAAVLLVKLRYLARWNEARRRVAARYREGLQGLPLKLPAESNDAKHVFHQFVVRLPQRDRLREFLKEKGVSTGIHYPLPLHLQPALKELGYKGGDFPVTERVTDEILSLPIFPELSDESTDYVIDCIHTFFRVC